VKVHEYQAMTLMAQFSIPGPEGAVADTYEEAIRLSEIFLSKYPKIFIKAQVHAGGRGKAGGIQGARNIQDARSAIKQILGMRLITPQTGAEGKIVHKVAIVDGSEEIESELYAGIILDRQLEQPVLMVSQSGGMEIEKIASETPEKIIKEHAHPILGLQPYQARKLAFRLGLSGNIHKEAVSFFLKLYKMYIELDATQVEINPMAITKSGKLWALDSKMNFDDSALFRHEAVAAMRDLNEETPLEIEASKHNLNYIKLDGSIGCMVNGAGLAMATMDIIKHYGSSPANFLDVGGGASEEAITHAFRILLADKDVRAVLVNIFGGIVRCDRVARGIIGAAKTVNLDRPLVVRLVGTNSEEGNRLLLESGLRLTIATYMDDAALKVIKALKGENA
jgi:succinyl-CoA synthetase beta subunit